MPVHVGQASVDAVVAEGQAFVVNAEQMQDGSVQVVAVSPAAGALVAELVAFTMPVQICTKRTPRSRRRRPIRQLRPKSAVMVSSRPYCLRVAALSSDRSSTPGALSCILAASSYEVIRDSRRESPGCCALWSSFSSLSSASPSASLCRVMCAADGGGLRLAMGTAAPGLMTIPW